MKITKIGKIASLIMIVSLVSKCFGATRDLALSYCYGSSNIADAYILATTLPVTIFSFLYEGIGASLIPVCSRCEDNKQRNQFIVNLINIIILISGVAIFIIELFPEFFVKLFASGFDKLTLINSVYILHISILGVVFSSAAFIISYYLNFHDSFFVTAFRSIPLDIVLIGSIVLSEKYDSLFILACGVPVSLFVALIVLLPQANKVGLKYSLHINFKDEKIKSVFHWSIPVALSMALIDINSIIDRQFASYLMNGGISIITYSSRLTGVINSLLFMPIITVLFPDFSKSVSEGKMEEVGKTTLNVLGLLLFVSIPLAFGVFVLSDEIVAIIFERGAFSHSAAVYTSLCLRNYALSIVAFSISTITTKLFYSIADMWTPMKITIIGVVLNIIGNCYLTAFWGIGGLPLASSISAVVVALLQLYFVAKKYNLELKPLLKTMNFMIVSSIVMAVCMVFFRNRLDYCGYGVLIAVLCEVIFAIFIYFGIMFMFKTKEVTLFCRVVKSVTERE